MNAWTTTGALHYDTITMYRPEEMCCRPVRGLEQDLQMNPVNGLSGLVCAATNLRSAARSRRRLRQLFQYHDHDPLQCRQASPHPSGLTGLALLFIAHNADRGF